MNWRPDNWEEIVTDNYTKNYDVGGRLCFEAGADAMLGVLMQEYTFSKIYDKDWYVKRQGGVWVFIPDLGVK